MRAYGQRAERILKDAKSMGDLGPCLGADLTASEVRYLMENEWAQESDDILWRRSKLGLKLTSEERAALDRFIAAGMQTNRSKS
jgi:glycerol-3-phosphate dehydrogenase